MALGVLCLAGKRLSDVENYVALFEDSSIVLTSIPVNAAQYGLLASTTGAHGGRTLMLAELTLLLAASDPDTDYAALRVLVIEDNVLLKSTSANRQEAFSRLRSLYGLDKRLVVWRVLRELWLVGEHDRPLLALLCAIGRDGLLRATAAEILDKPVGAVVTPEMLSTAVNARYTERYSPKMLASIGRNTISSWTQSGHLESRRESSREIKTRVHVQPGVGAAAYALLLGNLCGVQGVALFDTLFANVLDSPPNVLDALAFTASQRGWLEYRRLGDVAEIGFFHWLRASLPPE